MSLSPEIIDAMVESGCSVEQMAAVVKASLATQGEKAAEKRAKDAERQRKHRARNAVSRDVTVTECDSVTEPSPSPFPKENNQTPNPTPTRETKTRARKGHRLPEDWQPKALTGDTADAVRAWPSGAIERELAKFRDWAASANGPNALKKDWDAAWRNWLRKADEDGRYARKSNGNREDKRDGAMRALDRQLGLDQPPREAGRGDAGEGGSYLALTPSRTAAMR